MKQKSLIITTVAALFCCFVSLNAQEKKSYFVDGFHGGVYGHYPMETYTKFMADLHDDFPEWRFCLEIEPETWDTVKVRTPEDYERFKNTIVTSKRFEYTNPAYAQPYSYNISGESLIRHFEYGIKKLHQHFPEMTFTSYAVEEPCFASALPMILSQFGFKYASIKCPNTCWGGYSAAHGGELVRWIGPDGSSLIASPRHAIEELEEGRKVWETIAWGNDKKYLDACWNAGFKHPVGMTYQDAGWTGGPWLGYGEKTKNGSTYCTWTEYFEEICTDVEPEDYHFSLEDCLGSLMWGTQVMQNIGQEVRTSEINVTTAEKMSVIANIANGFVCNQDDIDEAWRTLLLSQHHDSWIVPYNGLHGKGTWATHIKEWTESSDILSRKVINQSMMSFAPRSRERRREASQGSTVFRVFNTSGESRSELVSLSLSSLPIKKGVIIRDSEGNIVNNVISFVDGERKLLFKAEAPAFGFNSYTFEADENAAPATSNIGRPTKILENSMYRIEFDAKRGGVIKSIIAKNDGRKDIVDASKGFAFGELRGFFYDEGIFRSSADSPATIVVCEDNQFQKSVRISGMISTHPFSETITIREGDPTIDFDLTIDWKGDVGIGAYRQDDAYNNPERAFYDERGKLNIYFPTVMEGGQLYKNGPFDVCESKLENTVFTNWRDIKHNIIVNWVDIEKGSDGFTLLSDHTTSYSYGDTPLALTVQYSGNGLWGRNYGISGPTHLHFAVAPHKGGWADAEARNLKWTEPFIHTIQRGIPVQKASYINVEGTGYEISAAHMIGEDVLVRFYNVSSDLAQQIVKIDPSFSTAVEVDLNGNEIKQVTLSNQGAFKGLPVSMNRFGIKTYILKR